MDCCDGLTALAESLHEQLWDLDAAELRALETPLLARLAAQGVSLAAVLAELSDESLALAFRAGFVAAEAFTALLVDRYGPYLARWGTESHEALDMIQQVHVSFYERGLAFFRPAAIFRAYLRRSVYHLWVQKVCREKQPRSLDGCEEPVSPRPDPEQALLDREAAERIDEALRQLPPREQSVVRETMAGKSAAEVAQALGLRKRQVFMSLFRGRRNLEKMLSLPSRKSRLTKDRPPPFAESRQGAEPCLSAYRKRSCWSNVFRSVRATGSGRRLRSVCWVERLIAPLVNLIELKRGLAPPERAKDLRDHARTCRYCCLWVSPAPAAADDPQAASLRRFDELASALPREEEQAQPVAPKDVPAVGALEDWSVPVHSGTFTSAFRYVHHPGALLDELGPVLPELLDDVGLATDLAERFRLFALRQPEEEWKAAAAWLPRTLERFARDELRLAALPCVLDRKDWEVVFNRCALRYLTLKPPFAGEAERRAASDFYRRLLERGVENWQQVAPSPAEQRRLAAETGVSEREIHTFVYEGRKCERSIVACCLSPARKR
jgi:RNA polymerase sigma factor (sigma-70 family)